MPFFYDAKDIRERQAGSSRSHTAPRETMLDLGEIRELLELQARAYDLLMWLADAANSDPEWLSPQVVAQLQHAGSAGEWLASQQPHLPRELLPPLPNPLFAGLLSSFFTTSFHVRHLVFNDRLLESRVTVGAQDAAKSTAGLEQCQALALRHLASGEKLILSEKEARLLVKRKSLHLPALLWTYIWELDRRARRKGKGEVVHRLWRCIPKETRKGLTPKQIWDARGELLRAVQTLIENRTA